MARTGPVEDPKVTVLRAARCLNPHPEAVTDDRFPPPQRLDAHAHEALDIGRQHHDVRPIDLGDGVGREAVDLHPSVESAAHRRRIGGDLPPARAGWRAAAGARRRPACA